LKPIRLTPTSYIVLGLLMHADGVTPYELKALVARGVGNLWSLQHTQLYAEPERLAAAGFLTETREEGGRRRKLYSITPSGRQAFGLWLTAELATELPELRDIGLLKVFFGAEPAPIAAEQLRAHREKLREYQQLEQALASPGPPVPELATTELAGPGPLSTLRAGIGHEREWIRYWADLAGEAVDPAG